MENLASFIREHFRLGKQPLAVYKHLHGLYKEWSAMSQYGFVLEEGFKTQAEAEAWVIEYYSDPKRIHLIKQFYGKA